MLVGETDKNTFRRIKYKFKTSTKYECSKVQYIGTLEGADSEVVFVKFMTVLFSQRDAACF